MVIVTSPWSAWRRGSAYGVAAVCRPATWAGVTPALSSLSGVPLGGQLRGRARFGMGGRPHVAGAAVHRGDVLVNVDVRGVVFLGEPTTGLDPAARLTTWRLLRGLADAGTTILLTTQYLEEADRLADSITVLSGGRVVAAGPPERLTAEIGQRRVARDPAVLEHPKDRVGLSTSARSCRSPARRRRLRLWRRYLPQVDGAVWTAV